MPAYPDDLARVAQMRGEGRTEQAIAAALGVDRKTLWNRVSAWNAQHPDAALPRPAHRPSVPRYVQAAEMRMAGRTPAEIAAAMDCSVSTVNSMLHRARAARVLPATTTFRDAGGALSWKHYAGKGAAPPLGKVSTILDGLSAASVLTLLEMVTTNDETLAHVVARIVKERLDG